MFWKVSSGVVGSMPLITGADMLAVRSLVLRQSAEAQQVSDGTDEVRSRRGRHGDRSRRERDTS